MDNWYYITSIQGLEISATSFSNIYRLFENLGINMRLGPAIDPRTNNSLLDEKNVIGIYMKQEEGNFVRLIRSERTTLDRALLLLNQSEKYSQEKDDL